MPSPKPPVPKVRAVALLLGGPQSFEEALMVGLTGGGRRGHRRYIVDCATCGYVGRAHGSRREAEASARIHRRDHRAGGFGGRR